MPEESVETFHETVKEVCVTLEETRPVGTEGGVLSVVPVVPDPADPEPEPAEYMDETSEAESTRLYMRTSSMVPAKPVLPSGALPIIMLPAPADGVPLV